MYVNVPFSVKESHETRAQKRKQNDDEQGYMEDEMQEATKKMDDRKRDQEEQFKSSIKGARISTPGGPRDLTFRPGSITKAGTPRLG